MEASIAMPVIERQAKPFAGIGKHISHSQVSLFDKCELAWFLKYVRGIIKPPTVHMILGQAYHKSLATNLSQKMITGVDLPVEEIISCFEDTFNAAVNDGDIDASPEVDLYSYRDPVSRLLHHYYQEYVIGKMEPILVEHAMTCPIPGCDRVFAGIVDVQLTDGRMIDFKTTSRRWNVSNVADTNQATAYAMLIGYDTDFEFHIGLRANKNPAVQVVRLERRRENVEQYVKHLRRVIRRMGELESGYEPAPRDGYCNEKMCQYYWECSSLR
jgi:hypothetical protein